MFPSLQALSMKISNQSPMNAGTDHLAARDVMGGPREFRGFLPDRNRVVLRRLGASDVVRETNRPSEGFGAY